MAITTETSDNCNVAAPPDTFITEDDLRHSNEGMNPSLSSSKEPNEIEMIVPGAAASNGAAIINHSEIEDVTYESHFTIRIPTSTLHFRGSLLRVVDTDEEQIIVQEVKQSDTKKILIKRIARESNTHKALRVGYTLITVLFLGFLFVFCFQVILFLFIALPVDSGYTTHSSTKVDGLSIVSTLLSFPIMLHGMSSLMALGSAFVIDTWKGGVLFRSTLVEILYMIVFLVVPTITLIISLMTRAEDPWKITASVWAIVVFLTFCSWSLAVTYKEVKACFWLAEKKFYASSNDATLTQNKWKKILTLMNISLLMSQIARYGGIMKERYHVAGMDNADDGDDEKGFTSSPNYTPAETSINLYSRLTARVLFTKWLNMFEVLDPPKRIYTLEEVRETLSIMTKSNWSMQSMWCGGANRKHRVIIARGPFALTPQQIKFTVLCSIISALLTILVLIGVLVWLDQGTGVYILIGVISIIWCIIPLMRNSLSMYRMYQSVHQGDDDDCSKETTIFQVWETVRITQPKPWYCYARAVNEILLLFLWPFASMLSKRNYPVAVVFLFLGGFSFLWRYFDASALLSEYGTVSKIHSDSDTHSKRYFFSEIMEGVINNRGRRLWSFIFILSSFAILFLFFASQQSSENIQPQQRANRPPILLVDDFFYPPQEETLSYPTCKISKGFSFPKSDADNSTGGSNFVDYSFLSALAYEKSSVTNYTLGRWFGQGAMVDEEEFVAQYRIDSKSTTNSVYFKLFSVPASPGYAVMSIRGSETSYDWIVNMQLWSSAGLAQVVKWFTPFGWIWSSALPDLIYWVSFVESPAIKNVAYYKVTTKFVNDLRAGYGNARFSKIFITGASLGGGLAVITGAQTKSYTVAISGLGAMLSRKAFDPPIEVEQLNAYTFNFIPDRDYIARIGGRQELYQNGQCIAPKNSLLGCHSMWRSVCEINYRCGSNGRPVVCKCVSQFGYPPPVQNGTRTFDEACEEANVEWDSMFPS